MTNPLYAQSTPRYGRGLMAAIWYGLLADYARNDPSFGVRIQDDFTKKRTVSGTTTSGVAEGWRVADAAAAGGTYSFDTVAGVGGIAELSSTGTTNHFGVEASSEACLKLPTGASSPQGDLVFQARFDPGDADTIFVGLSETGDNFLSATSQLPTSADYLGFYSEDNGVTWALKTYNDNNGGTAASGSFTIPAADYDADGYNNFGFRVKKDGSLEIAVNDKWYGPAVHGITSDELPIETLCVRLSATAGGGTTAPTVEFDSVDCFNVTV